ncbi:hypothetical protein HHL23_22005 [Chryseobacterium sp. RP-3-3]|uniref:Uncharacterized protein n=1 Tax=Chryseobacterium antibioticum TaxID=2728847 RepID=A0A7Y0FTL2_9FLAO|nr:hypothetical protein [Chryseobacterium antibioticum]NML72433.1 hypothetical protein [Chryseobacterium antibioticum]
MRHLQQQLEPVLSLCKYKGASLLLFIFLMFPKLNAQNFYYEKGTKITIRESTIFYTVDSGAINQTRLKDFEGQISARKQTLNETKQIAFNDKKSRLSIGKIKKESALKASKEKAKTYPKVESVECVKLCPDNFLSTEQKGIAILSSVIVHYHPKFLIENIRFKLLYVYPKNANNEIINSNPNFLKDYHLFQCMIRPPPFKFYF